MSESDSRASQLIIACSIVLTLATVGVALRLYSRIKITKNVGADDAVLLMSWVLQTVCAAFIINQTRYGLGRHFTTISMSELEGFLKMSYGSTMAYNLSLALTKISILLQYYRFLSTPLIRILCHIVLAFIILYGITTIVTSAILCLPLGSFWDLKKRHYCLDTGALWIAHACLNILTDLIIIILPLPIILNLTMPKKQKYGVVAVFTVGIVVCLISILRLKVIRDGEGSKDFSWDNADAATWSQVEISIAIFCASLPGMKPLIYKWIGLSDSSTSRSYSTDRTSKRGLGPNDIRECELDTSGMGAVSSRVIGDEEHVTASTSPLESPLGFERCPFDEMDENGERYKKG